MINVIKKSECSGCYSCASRCPKKCIEMVSDAEGFWYPKVDTTQCINCGVCEDVCPILTPCLSGTGKHIDAYATKNKEDSVRLNSSSGGVFSALADYVLSQNGVVFGASFDGEFNVVHKYVEKTEQLEVLRGSKYVQSRIGDSYCQAEAFLKEGRLVLFSGTPCQIEGLLSYLKEPYDNLITQDLICHGVPSPSVWKKYVEYRRTAANGEKPCKISFRSKNEGWKRFSVSFIFENGTEYRTTLDKDPMMQVFLKNLCLRPSCYDCSFKNKARRSDITLADFWGIKNVLPDMDDDKGTSLVIIQSEKGHELFEKIKDSIIFKETDVDVAVSYNTSMIKSVDIPKRRNAFFKEISSDNFLKIQNKYCKVKFSTKLKRVIVKSIRKIKSIVRL